MDDHTFQIMMALIAVISTLTGGTGAAFGFKANSKHKTLREKLTKLETEVQNLKKSDDTLREMLVHMDKKIDKIKDILIQKKEGK